MTPADAARILQVPPDATPELLERHFHELRAKLEDKIAKAPTPGLKEKYRTSLAEITEAFETLVLLADSALLPVLQSEPPANLSPVGAAPEVAPIPAPARAGSPRTGAPAKSHDREFKLVTLLAIVVLLAGGWWVMSLREENARQAAAAEQQKQMEERARIQAAEAERAESARKESAIARLRTEFAEARLGWDSFEKEERNTERTLAEYKSEARNRDLPQTKLNEYAARVLVTQRYLSWLTAKLDRHPATIARAKVEELLSARLPDEAESHLREMQSAVAELGSEIAEQRTLLEQLHGSVEVHTTPPGLDFEIVDGLGQTHRGRSPARLNGLGPGQARLTASRQGFANEQTTFTVEPGKASRADLGITSETVTVNTEPDTEIWSNNKFISRGQFTFHDYKPDTYALQLRRPNTQSFSFNVEIKQGKTARALNYSLVSLANQNIPCPHCDHRGYTEEENDCSNCGGDGGFRCRVCGGDGILYVINGVSFPCLECNRGRIRCNTCTGNGSVVRRNRCTHCGGDGYQSQIDQGR